MTFLGDLTEMETTFIYALCEPGTRTIRYIGKANDPKRRFREHLRKSRISDTYLGRWLRKLGDVRPSLVFLRQVPVEAWQIAEERYIRLARGLGMSLVNTAEGGEGGNMTPEVRKKIGDTSRGRRASEVTRLRLSASKQGEKNPCFGKIYSEEERRVRSEALKGPKNHNFGTKFSPERRAQISASLTGKTRSKESREKQSRSIQAFWAKKKAIQS